MARHISRRRHGGATATGSHGKHNGLHTAAVAAYLLHKKGVFAKSSVPDRPGQADGTQSSQKARGASSDDRTKSQGSQTTQSQPASETGLFAKVGGTTPGSQSAGSDARVFVKEHSITRDGKEITIPGHYRVLGQ